MTAYDTGIRPPSPHPHLSPKPPTLAGGVSSLLTQDQSSLLGPTPAPRPDTASPLKTPSPPPLKPVLIHSSCGAPPRSASRSHQRRRSGSSPHRHRRHRKQHQREERDEPVAPPPIPGHELSSRVSLSVSSAGTLGGFMVGGGDAGYDLGRSSYLKSNLTSARSADLSSRADGSSFSRDPRHAMGERFDPVQKTKQWRTRRGPHRRQSGVEEAKAWKRLRQLKGKAAALKRLEEAVASGRHVSPRRSSRRPIPNRNSTKLQGSEEAAWLDGQQQPLLDLTAEEEEEAPQEQAKKTSTGEEQPVLRASDTDASTTASSSGNESSTSSSSHSAETSSAASEESGAAKRHHHSRPSVQRSPQHSSSRQTRPSSPQGRSRRRHPPTSAEQQQIEEEVDAILHSGKARRQTKEDEAIQRWLTEQVKLEEALLQQALDLQDVSEARRHKKKPGALSRATTSASRCRSASERGAPCRLHCSGNSDFIRSKESAYPEANHPDRRGPASSGKSQKTPPHSPPTPFTGPLPRPSPTRPTRSDTRAAASSSSSSARLRPSVTHHRRPPSSRPSERQPTLEQHPPPPQEPVRSRSCSSSSTPCSASSPQPLQTAPEGGARLDHTENRVEEDARTTVPMRGCGSTAADVPSPFTKSASIEAEERRSVPRSSSLNPRHHHHHPASRAPSSSSTAPSQQQPQHRPHPNPMRPCKEGEGPAEHSGTSAPQRCRSPTSTRPETAGGCSSSLAMESRTGEGGGGGLPPRCGPPGSDRRRSSLTVVVATANRGVHLVSALPWSGGTTTTSRRSSNSSPHHRTSKDGSGSAVRHSHRKTKALQPTMTDASRSSPLKSARHYDVAVKSLRSTTPQESGALHSPVQTPPSPSPPPTHIYAAASPTVSGRPLPTPLHCHSPQPTLGLPCVPSPLGEEALVGEGTNRQSPLVTAMTKEQRVRQPEVAPRSPSPTPGPPGMRDHHPYAASPDHHPPHSTANALRRTASRSRCSSPAMNPSPAPPQQYQLRSDGECETDCPEGTALHRITSRQAETFAPEIRDAPRVSRSPSQLEDVDATASSSHSPVLRQETSRRPLPKGSFEKSETNSPHPTSPWSHHDFHSVSPEVLAALRTPRTSLTSRNAAPFAAVSPPTSPPHTSSSGLASRVDVGKDGVVRGGEALERTLITRDHTELRDTTPPTDLRATEALDTTSVLNDVWKAAEEGGDAALHSRYRSSSETAPSSSPHSYSTPKALHPSTALRGGRSSQASRRGDGALKPGDLIRRGSSAGVLSGSALSGSFLQSVGAALYAFQPAASAFDENVEVKHPSKRSEEGGRAIEPNAVAAGRRDEGDVGGMKRLPSRRDASGTTMTTSSPSLDSRGRPTQQDTRKPKRCDLWRDDAAERMENSDTLVMYYQPGRRNQARRRQQQRGEDGKDDALEPKENEMGLIFIASQKRTLGGLVSKRGTPAASHRFTPPQEGTAPASHRSSCLDKRAGTSNPAGAGMRCGLELSSVRWVGSRSPPAGGNAERETPPPPLPPRCLNNGVVPPPLLSTREIQRQHQKTTARALGEPNGEEAEVGSTTRSPFAAVSAYPDVSDSRDAQGPPQRYPSRGSRAPRLGTGCFYPKAISSDSTSAGCSASTSQSLLPMMGSPQQRLQPTSSLTKWEDCSASAAGRGPAPNTHSRPTPSYPSPSPSHPAQRHDGNPHSATRAAGASTTAPLQQRRTGREIAYAAVPPRSFTPSSSPERPSPPAARAAALGGASATHRYYQPPLPVGGGGWERGGGGTLPFASPWRQERRASVNPSSRRETHRTVLAEEKRYERTKEEDFSRFVDEDEPLKWTIQHFKRLSRRAGGEEEEAADIHLSAHMNTGAVLLDHSSPSPSLLPPSGPAAAAAVEGTGVPALVESPVAESSTGRSDSCNAHLVAQQRMTYVTQRMEALGLRRTPPVSVGCERAASDRPTTVSSAGVPAPSSGPARTGVTSVTDPTAAPPPGADVLEEEEEDTFCSPDPRETTLVKVEASDELFPNAVRPASRSTALPSATPKNEHGKGVGRAGARAAPRETVQTASSSRVARCPSPTPVSVPVPSHMLRTPVPAEQLSRRPPSPSSYATAAATERNEKDVKASVPRQRRRRSVHAIATELGERPTPAPSPASTVLLLLQERAFLEDRLDSIDSWLRRDQPPGAAVGSERPAPARSRVAGDAVPEATHMKRSSPSPERPVEWDAVSEDSPRQALQTSPSSASQQTTSCRNPFVSAGEGMTAADVDATAEWRTQHMRQLSPSPWPRASSTLFQRRQRTDRSCDSPGGGLPLATAAHPYEVVPQPSAPSRLASPRLPSDETHEPSPLPHPPPMTNAAHSLFLSSTPTTVSPTRMNAQQPLPLPVKISLPSGLRTIAAPARISREATPSRTPAEAPTDPSPTAWEDVSPPHTLGMMPSLNDDVEELRPLAPDPWNGVEVRRRRSRYRLKRLQTASLERAEDGTLHLSFPLADPSRAPPLGSLQGHTLPATALPGPRRSPDDVAVVASGAPVRYPPASWRSGGVPVHRHVSHNPATRRLVLGAFRISEANGSGQQIH